MYASRVAERLLNLCSGSGSAQLSLPTKRLRLHRPGSVIMPPA